MLATAKRIGLLFALWLLLRGALVLAGGELGSGQTLELADRHVAALFFRGAQPAKTLVVVTHGGLASKETMLPSCWQARERGVDCVAIDLLSHGASDPAPAARYFAEARRALRADREFGEYADVHFVGHSLGAALGCGAAFACDQSVAVGQTTPCQGRSVWGDLHRRLGLPEGFYLLVSHLLEPWTPNVVRRAISLALPHRAGESSDGTSIRIGLAWASWAVMAMAGVQAARFVRARGGAGPWARGAMAACALWVALCLGGWRALWYLWPSQPSDWAIIGLTTLTASALGFLARSVGARRGRWGLLAAVVCVELGACAVQMRFPARELSTLLMLPPFLLAPVSAIVAWCERLSRPPESDPLESAAFASVMLGAFLALLVPGV